MKNKYHVHSAAGLMDEREYLGVLSVDDKTAMNPEKLMRAAHKKFGRRDLLVDTTRIYAPDMGKTPPILKRKKDGDWQ
jgi:hypothetical protein